MPKNTSNNLMNNGDFKIIAAEILEEIKKAKKILLCFHPNPDFDSVGGVLAMRRALTAMGKSADVIKGDSDIPQFAKYLPDTEYIIEKNFLETDLSQYDLFIALDASAALERLSLLGEVKLPTSLRIVRIDHHMSIGRSFAHIDLADENSPATCQILHDLFAEWGIEITKEMSILLFAGIYYDTGGLKYPKTDSKTFLIMANLAKTAPDFHNTISQIENNQEEDTVLFQGLALSSIETFFDGKAAVSTVSFGELKKRSIKNELRAGDIATILKSVAGWMVGVSIVEKEPSIIKVSFRSKDAERYDVFKIAAVLGGGGHRAAASAVINKPLAEAKEMIINAMAKSVRL